MLLLLYSLFLFCCISTHHFLFANASSSAVTTAPTSATNPRIIFLQIITEDYIRHPWEWDRDVFPYSIIDISKISISSYAKRHGYDYKLLRIASADLLGRSPVWVKILGLKLYMAQHFDEYDYMVFCDVDLFVMQPKVPLIQKMQQWTSPGTKLEEIDCFTPFDTEVAEVFQVPYGSTTGELVRGINTGIQIWKVSEKSQMIIEKWYNNTEIPGTGKYLTEFKHEQGSFNYLQEYWGKTYGFKFQAIDCNEANGFPAHWHVNTLNGIDLGNHGCSGNFVSHFWEESKRYVMPWLLQLLSIQYYEYMLEEISSKNEIFLQEEKEIPTPRANTMNGKTQIITQDNKILPVAYVYDITPEFLYNPSPYYQSQIRNLMIQNCLGVSGASERSCLFFGDNVVDQALMYRKWLLLDDERQLKQFDEGETNETKMKTMKKIIPERVRTHLSLLSKQRLIPATHVAYLQSLKDSGFEPKVIYDIGASLTHWTTEANLLWPNAEIILFDGFDTAEFIYIESGRPYHVGVLSNEDNKEVTFFQNDMFPGGNSYYREVGDPLQGQHYPDWTGQKRKAMTLDSIVAQRGFPLPDMVKIDVQGAERDIIEGGLKAIRHAKHLVVEMQYTDFNLNAPKVTETLPYIESLGFKCVAPAFSATPVDADYGFVRIEKKQEEL
jgi:FkbM family methyltransferase